MRGMFSIGFEIMYEFMQMISLQVLRWLAELAKGNKEYITFSCKHSVTSSRTNFIYVVK